MEIVCYMYIREENCDEGTEKFCVITKQFLVLIRKIWENDIKCVLYIVEICRHASCRKDKMKSFFFRIQQRSYFICQSNKKLYNARARHQENFFCLLYDFFFAKSLCIYIKVLLKIVS